MFSSSYLLAPLLLASYVSAHGFVHQFTVNGKTFTSANPSGQRSNRASAIRQVTSQDPIYGADNANLNCGNGAFVASDVANVNAGDSLAFDWRDAALGKWPHDSGPILTYMADCGNKKCSEFDSRQAKWFKIDQKGLKPNSDQWWQADLFQSKTVSVKIPENLAPGNYLMRHEVIGLHIADKRRGAEFYPSCAQLVVSGSGTGKPSANELVSFPGGYNDDDKGLFVNIFSGNMRNYVFPGPPVSKLAASGGNSGSGSEEGDAPAPAPSSTQPAGGNGGSGKPTATSSGTKPTQTSKGGNGNNNNNNNGGSANSGSGSSTSGPKTTQVCKIKKGNKSKSNKASSPTVRPRHMSRVMRRLAMESSVHAA